MGSSPSLTFGLATHANSTGPLQFKLDLMLLFRGPHEQL